MELNRICYSLGFLPTYVTREVQELARRGCGIDIHLPAYESRSEYWMKIVEDIDPEGGITFSRDLQLDILNCSGLRLMGYALSLMFSIMLHHPLRSFRNAFVSLRKRSFRFFLLGVSLAQRIRGGTDLIHSHFARPAAMAGFWASRLLNLPFTVTTHAVDIYVPQREELVKYMLHRASGILTISRFNRDYICRRFGPELEHRITVTHLGLDPSGLPERIFDPGRPATIVCTASGLGEKKGVPVLMKAVKIMVRRGIEFRCRVIGSDPSGELLEKYTAEAEDPSYLGRLEFAGLFTSSQVMNELSGADVFVLPCIRASNGDMDGIPVSLMESMSMGIPTVSTRLTGIPELIEDGKSGILVQPEDPEMLADSLQRLLEDEELRSRVSLGGRERVLSEFNVQRYIDLLQDTWSGIIQDR